MIELFDMVYSQLFSDSFVYIWKKETGQQVAVIEAHQPGTVNCVAWHPTNFNIFASAGDDHKVKVYVGFHSPRCHELAC